MIHHNGLEHFSYDSNDRNTAIVSGYIDGFALFRYRVNDGCLDGVRNLPSCENLVDNLCHECDEYISAVLQVFSFQATDVSSLLFLKLTV